MVPLNTGAFSEVARFVLLHPRPTAIRRPLHASLPRLLLDFVTSVENGHKADSDDGAEKCSAASDDCVVRKGVA